VSDTSDLYVDFLRRAYKASGCKVRPTWTTLAGKAVVQILGLAYNNPALWTDANAQAVGRKIKANVGT
jgi:hypothetical protein